MFDRNCVIEFLSSQLPSVEHERLEAALAQLDLERICELQAERYSWKLWEGEPINGCPREEMIELGMVIPAESSAAFVIRDSRAGRVVLFQPFDPDLPNFGALKLEARARELAELNINKLACTSSLAAIVEAVKLHLD